MENNDHEQNSTRTICKSYVVDDEWNLPEEIIEVIDLTIEEAWESCNRQVLFHKFRQINFHNPRHLRFHSPRHFIFHTCHYAVSSKNDFLFSSL